MKLDQHQLLVVVLAALLAAGASAITTRFALRFLRRRQILDKPNERSSHTLPTPRGLGLGVIPVVVSGWVALSILYDVPREVWALCGGATLLAILSLVDDVRGLPAGPRLLAQIVVVVVGTSFFEPPYLFPSTWLPPVVSQVIAALLWLGLINQINFTDGIDGNLGAFLVCVCVGLFGICLVGNVSWIIGVLAIVIAGAALGFLPLNWSPARAFMGDVGSVPLGYLVGWLLLRIASYGQWVPVIILPLFYFADTAVTYSGRIARRERFWEPHRKYAYQRATAGMSHRRIVSIAICCNLALLVIGLDAATGRSWLLLLAFAPVAIAYGLLERAAHSKKTGA